MVTTIGTGRTETIETGRRNLSVNPSLETTLAPYNAGGNCTIARVSAGGVVGPYSLEQTVTANGASFVYDSLTVGGLAVVEGQRYYVSAAVRAVIWLRPMDVGIVFRNAAGGAVWGSTYGPAVTPSIIGGGYRLSHSAVAPAGAATVQVVLRSAAAVAGDKYRWDALMIAPSDAPYFDGSTAPLPPYSYTWAGAVGASQSIEWITQPVQVQPVLVDGFEASREVRNIVHPVLNKSNPDVTLRAPGLRSGEFRCLFQTQADALAAYERLSVPQVFTVSDPEMPAIDMSFVIGSLSGRAELRIELDDETRRAWWVVAPFVEVIP